jgi:CelD/BcsL family acetyltransferase involved in cellulose biosynthesis
MNTKGKALGLSLAIAELKNGSSWVRIPLAIRKVALGLRRAVGIGEPHFDYQIPTARLAENDWATFWSSMWPKLSSSGGLSDLLIRRLPASVCAGSGLADDDVETALIDLHGLQDLESLLSTKGSSLRTDVRRQRRRADESGGVQIQVMDDRSMAEARATLRDLRAAYEELHQQEASAVLFRQPGTWEFYQEVLERLLPKGYVHLTVLRVGGRPAAWHFGFLLNGALHWYKPTYASWAAKLSPGKLLLAEVATLGIRSGWKLIDLGGGLEPYKKQWGSRFEPLRCQRFFGGNWGGRLLRWRASRR